MRTAIIGYPVNHLDFSEPLGQITTNLWCIRKSLVVCGEEAVHPRDDRIAEHLIGKLSLLHFGNEAPAYHASASPQGLVPSRFWLRGRHRGHFRSTHSGGQRAEEQRGKDAGERSSHGILSLEMRSTVVSPIEFALCAYQRGGISSSGEFALPSHI